LNLEQFVVSKLLEFSRHNYVLLIEIWKYEWVGREQSHIYPKHFWQYSRIQFKAFWI